MSVFHYALKPHGFLMLGHAETVGAHSDLFALMDKRHRVFQKKAAAVPRAGALAATTARSRAGRTPGAAAARGIDGRARSSSEADRVVLERYAPPGVVVDDDLQIVQFRGQTGRFLEPAPGEPSLNLLKMAREGLLYGLRAALQTARARRAGRCARTGCACARTASWHDVDVEVDAARLAAASRTSWSCSSRAAGDRAARSRAVRRRPARRRPRASGSRARASSQRELASSREYLQSIIQELEAANEELQSANEEILSSNEELQSTNEELDTAKEELQSTNEELNTVNEELHGRNEELSRVNSDLVNLLAASRSRSSSSRATCASAASRRWRSACST